jgi:hypothetical protein
MTSTDEGREINESDRHWEIASFLTSKSREDVVEPLSNVSFERASQPRKHPRPMISTDQGRQIEKSDEHREKASLSMRRSREPGAKATTERVSHVKKHRSQRTSTVDGMHMDGGDEEQANASQ